MADFLARLVARRKKPAAKRRQYVSERRESIATRQELERTLAESTQVLDWKLRSILRRSRMLPPSDRAVDSDPKDSEAELELQKILEEQVADDMAFCRKSLESGKIFKLPNRLRSDEACSERNPLCFLLKVLLGVNQPLALNHRLTLVLWFVNAGARIDYEDEDEREVWRDVLLFAPELANAVSPQSRSLKQLSALAVRSHLHHSLEENVKSLPLPTIMKDYVVRSSLDVDPILLQSLMERMKANSDLPAEKYTSIWYEICPPVVRTVCF